MNRLVHVAIAAGIVAFGFGEVPATGAFPGRADAVGAPVAAPQNAESLLDLHVTWRGGRAALTSRAIVERRGMVRIGARAGTLRTLGAADGRLRVDVKFDDVQQAEAVTPHGGWRWVNGEITDLDDERIAALRVSIDQMLGRHLLLESGYTVEGLGTETKSGRSYEVLRLSNRRDRLDLFIDPADGSHHWSRELDETGEETWTQLGDWRRVNGLRYAFRSDLRPDDPDRRQLTEWEDVIVGGELDAGQFLRPPVQSGVVEFDDGVDWTPFTHFLDSYIQLPGTVSGNDARVMLDSGAAITVLDLRFAERLGLRTRSAGTIRGIGGEAPLRLADGVDVAVPGVSLRGATVAVLDLSEIADVMGRGFQVVLGAELFSRAVVKVDYPGRRVSFAPPQSYEPPDTASSVTMYSRRGIPRVTCRYETLPEALCAVDTGSNGTVNIVASYVDEHDMLADRPMVSTIATGGVGGMIETLVSTLRDFEFAGVSVSPAPASFMADAIGSLDTDEIVGNIGASMLRSLVVVFDYPGMRFHVLQPGRPEPIRRDRSGLQAVFRGDHLEVFFVSPGGAAERAGFETGERITAINGEPITSAYIESGFRWRYGAPGTEVVVTDSLGRNRTLVLTDYF